MTEKLSANPAQVALDRLIKRLRTAKQNNLKQPFDQSDTDMMLRMVIDEALADTSNSKKVI